MSTMYSKTTADTHNTLKRNSTDAAFHRMNLGCEIGEGLSAAATSVNDAETLAVADMILEASRDLNIWHGEDLHNADGECFEAYGSLNFSSSRLDPAYMAMSSRRARRRVKDSLARVEPQHGEKLRLVTLTMPKINASFDETMSIFDDARVRLRKRQWFKTVFRGGVFSGEFTLGERGDHYHVHCHVIAWSKAIVWEELGDEWTHCLIASALRHGAELDFPTTHRRAVVDVRMVTSRRYGEGAISMDVAIQKVTNYITKGSTFAKLSPSQLVEVEHTLRCRRMIETFGEANNRKGKVKLSIDLSVVDERCPYFNSQHTIDGDTPAVVKKARAVRTNPIVKRGRMESLRVTGARMIRAGKRESWIEMLRYVNQERRDWRKAQLARRFPAATFRTLAGEVWYGDDKARTVVSSERAKSYPVERSLPLKNFSLCAEWRHSERVQGCSPAYC